MIYRYKLKSFTENELALFCYIFFQNKEIIPYHHLTWLQLPVVIERLNQTKSKLKDEFQTLIDSMVTKLKSQYSSLE